MLNITIIRETQIKTTMRYQFTPVRVAIIEKSTISKCWKGYGEREPFLHCWWECKLVQLLWRIVLTLFKKLELPYDPAILLLGIYLEKIVILKDTCIPVSPAALFTIAKTWKQHKCPSWEEHKEDVACIYNGILAIKENKIMPHGWT